MHLTKRISFLTLFLAGWFGAWAQTPLSIYKNDVTPGVITFGDTFSFTAFIRNDSSNIHIGSLRLNYSINGTLYTLSDDTSGVEFDSIPAAFLIPGDSLPVYLKVNVFPPRFSTGPSVVVIWPIRNSGTQVYAKDSLVLNFVVAPAVGMSQIDNESMKLYVLNRSLQIGKDAKIQLKQVRIIDILGREILNKLNPPDNIPLPDTNRGICIAEITYNENQRAVFRFCY